MFPRWRRAASRARPAAEDADPGATKDYAELIRVGLPGDWKFELPKQWKSDGGVLSKTPPRRQGSGIFVSGVKAESTGGELRFGSLEPGRPGRADDAAR